MKVLCLEGKTKDTLDISVTSDNFVARILTVFGLLFGGVLLVGVPIFVRDELREVRESGAKGNGFKLEAPAVEGGGLCLTCWRMGSLRDQWE